MKLRFKWGPERGPVSGIQRRTSCFSFPFSRDKQDSTQPEGVSVWKNNCFGAGEGPQLGLEGGFAAWSGSTITPLTSILPGSGCSLGCIRQTWLGDISECHHRPGGKGTGAPIVSALNLTLGPRSVLQDYKGSGGKVEGFGSGLGRVIQATGE